MLRRRYSNVPVIKYGLLWLLIFFTIAIFYSYKDIFYSTKDRLLAELVPGYKIEHEGEIIVKKADDGHYYIYAEINDHKFRFLIDTGASHVLISQSMAESIGIDLNKLVFNNRAETANGTVRTASIVVDNFKVGEMKFTNFPICVNQVELSKPLLGMTFLKKLKSYEFVNDMLIMKY